MDDHALDTMLRDAHRTAPPDPATISRARAELMATIGGEQIPTPRPPRRRNRRRIGLAVGLVGAGMLGAVGAAAAGGLFDPNTEQMVDEAPCDVAAADARLVASETNADGRVFEYWIIDRTSSYGDLIVEKLPDGTAAGGQFACSPEPRGDIPFYAGHAWASAGMTYIENVSTELSIYGQIPPGVDAATVELSDGTTVTVTPDDAQGYFLHVLTLPPIANIDVVDLTPRP